MYKYALDFCNNPHSGRTADQDALPQQLLPT